QRAVEQRPYAIVLDDGGAAHLADKAAAEDTPDRPAGMVGTEREQERGGDAVLAQDFDQVRHALARAAKRVDVDLEREMHQSTRRRASATCPRYASKMRVSASSMPTTGFQSRSAHVLAIFGTRFCTS